MTAGPFSCATRPQSRVGGSGSTGTGPFHHEAKPRVSRVAAATTIMAIVLATASGAKAHRPAWARPARVKDQPLTAAPAVHECRPGLRASAGSVWASGWRRRPGSDRWPPDVAPGGVAIDEAVALGHAGPRPAPAAIPQGSGRVDRVSEGHGTGPLRGFTGGGAVSASAGVGHRPGSDAECLGKTEQGLFQHREIAAGRRWWCPVLRLSTR